ncbi:MAG: glycosyltransferase family 2 protein [Streptosporangiaceae bacterium]
MHGVGVRQQGRPAPAAEQPPPPLPGYIPWKPSILPFLIPTAIMLAGAVYLYSPNRTPLGWFLTVIWSLPAIPALIGIQGVLLARRRARQLRRMAPPTPVPHDSLLVVVPTIGRHDTYPALERSVLSYVEHLPAYFPRLLIEVIDEEGCEAHDRITALARLHHNVRVVTVPKAYRTVRGTRFKARANHYSHELRVQEGAARDDVWVLHMDDDTGVGPDTAAAMAQFINRQRRAGAADAKHMAQGILTYPRENAVNRFTWLADAVRPADDIARFRAITGMGTPVAGVHGELLLLRASIEATIGWDFGPDAIVEDAQLALTFSSMYPGRSDWFSGRCYGASPATVRDFVKQRERWAWGLVALSFNETIPFKYRSFMAFCVCAWILGPVQHLAIVLPLAWLSGNMNTSPISIGVTLLWAVNTGYSVWCYWEGLRINGHVSANGRRLWWEPIVTVALIPVFALIEGYGSFSGLIKYLRAKENQFIVIQKPA